MQIKALITFDINTVALENREVAKEFIDQQVFDLYKRNMLSFIEMDMEWVE